MIDITHRLIATSRPLLATALGVVSLGALAAFAAPAPHQESGDDGPSIDVKVATDLVPKVDRLLATQGGQERVEALVGFDFVFTDIDVEAPLEEGGEAREIPGEPIRMSIGLNPTDRRVRMAQTLRSGDNTQELVRIAASDGMGVFIDGESRSSDQLAAEARDIALQVLVVLDLQWGLLNGQVSATDDGARTRDGVEYDSVRVLFPESRGMQDPFRIYMDRETGLVRRADQYSALTSRRRATLFFESWAVVDGLHLPQRVSFFDRDRQLERIWTFEGFEVDPEWSEDHFSID
ncbi:MAG: hypothetical protein ACYTFV_02375 [Planctomycetota bacterium]|jgi:hypothetical protein